MADLSATIVESVTAACEQDKPLYIHGGNSKRHLLGRVCEGEPLDLSGHCGIVDYQPRELVLTARAGTPLAEIQELLAQHGQMLPFEPPQFEGKATLGGTLACNLSGPGRPWYGSIRDMVLGVKLVNGKAELLSFGGQVMKNVAGYDVSRLQAGALGTLGVISEISIKVLPRPELTATLVYATDAPRALEVMNQRAGEPAPLTGAFWLEGQLYLRISGAASAVRQTASDWGGERLSQAEQTWSRLRDLGLPYFQEEGVLWRLSLDSTAPLDTPPEATLIDWAGAQRWLQGEADFARLQESANRYGGHACLFRGGDRSGEVRQNLEPTHQRLQQRLKQAFDPRGIINPGRLYSWL